MRSVGGELLIKMNSLFCSVSGPCSHVPAGADGMCRARAAAVCPRRGGACQTELHQDGDPEGGARAAGQQEHVGAEPGPDGERLFVTSRVPSVQ